MRFKLATACVGSSHDSRNDPGRSGLAWKGNFPRFCWLTRRTFGSAAARPPTISAVRSCEPSSTTGTCSMGVVRTPDGRGSPIGATPRPHSPRSTGPPCRGMRSPRPRGSATRPRARDTLCGSRTLAPWPARCNSPTRQAHAASRSGNSATRIPASGRRQPPSEPGLTKCAQGCSALRVAGSAPAVERNGLGSGSGPGHQARLSVGRDSRIVCPRMRQRRPDGQVARVRASEHQNRR